MTPEIKLMFDAFVEGVKDDIWIAFIVLALAWICYMIVRR